jgi:hypothetical protein
MPKQEASNMSVETILVVYDGTPVEKGAMDVRDLAPALLSIAELCQEVNSQVYGNDTAISVRVKADFKKGSFGVELEIVRTLIEQVRSLLNSTDTQSAMAVIGLIFGSSGLIELLKLLKGDGNAQTTTLENGNIKIEISGDGNNHIEVKPQNSENR